MTIETGADPLKWVASTHVRIVLGTVPFNFMGPVDVLLDPASESQLFTAAVTSTVEVQGPQPRLFMEVLEDGAGYVDFDNWDITKVSIKQVATGKQWQYGPYKVTESTAGGELPFISQSGPQTAPDTCQLGAALDATHQLCATCQHGSVCPGGYNAAASQCGTGQTTATLGSTTAADCMALKATGSNAFVAQVTTCTNYTLTREAGPGRAASTYTGARITLVGTEGVSNPLRLNYQAANCSTTSWITEGVTEGLSSYQLSGVGRVGALQSIVLSLEDPCSLGPGWVFEDWQVTSVQIADRTTGATYTCPAHDKWVEGANNFELRVGCQPTPGLGEGRQHVSRVHKQGLKGLFSDTNAWQTTQGRHGVA